MTITDLRDNVVRLLSASLGVPVILADTPQPEPAYPFAFYSMISSYMPTGEQGDYTQTPGASSVSVSRKEQPFATFSFTFNSVDREENGITVYGDDEVQTLTDAAVSFFQIGGYESLSALGIVPVEIMDVANRTIFEVDDVARRYGFDVRVRYTRTDTATIPDIEHILASEV